MTFNSGSKTPGSKPWSSASTRSGRPDAFANNMSRMVTTADSKVSGGSGMGSRRRQRVKPSAVSHDRFKHAYYDAIRAGDINKLSVENMVLPLGFDVDVDVRKDYIAQMDSMGMIQDKYKPYLERNGVKLQKPGTAASGGGGLLPKITDHSDHAPAPKEMDAATAAQRDIAEKKKKDRLADSQRRQMEKYYERIRDTNAATKFQMQYSMMDLTRPSSAKQRKGEAHRVTKKDGQYC